MAAFLVMNFFLLTTISYFQLWLLLIQTWLIFINNNFEQILFRLIIRVESIIKTELCCAGDYYKK